MANTHAVEVGSAAVVKRFRRWDQGEHRREWRALTLLAEHAPGLAPVPGFPQPTDPDRPPGRADLEADPPSVTMTRLEGVPLAGRLTDAQVGGLAEAVAAVQEAIPGPVLRALPFRLLHPLVALRRLRAWCARRPSPDGDPLVVRAFGAVTDWVGRPRLDDVFSAEFTPVFGLGDGNLANYLWDGARVRIVDFEYSGLSDRAYELAEVVEHISVWVDDGLDAPAFLSRFELTPAETARLRECRRLLALYWFRSVLSEDPERPRNPPGTAARQAGRLLALLGA
ncbi:phosphotransferase [Actinoallomurus iriomotensis]|uniref:Aminoglycoside phosphotransferase domain-containing protein n=1 Tax=Actinoallomurus iriomotensis TaxID=478107 RepID=A0A9W6W480_9ACTN|nr:phosphotransferase [Actinoallomurus iriomotensis]GLY90204.1 hypothetical protein Airi02_081330 [Actinoallomurus iriomotensis]